MSRPPQLDWLPQPDPDAPDRIWARFRHSRQTRRPPLGWAVPLGALLAAGALAFTLWPEQTAHEELVAASAPAALTWSDQVQLDFTGQGRASGTSRDLSITWESGTLRASVVPQSGTSLRIETDEAIVEVVGTVFSVTRDRLGATTEVERGTVSVTCRDGWSGLVTAHTGPRTCLPVTPAGLLGRADALVDRGADDERVVQTLDRGIAGAATGTAVHGELLVRRMHLHAEGGRTTEALTDALTYLDHDQASRAVEVHRVAAWLLLARDGCEGALSHLQAAQVGGVLEDQILLAECLVESDPTEARALVTRLDPDALDPAWTSRLEALRLTLGTP